MITPIKFDHPARANAPPPAARIYWVRYHGLNLCGEGITINIVRMPR